MKNNHLFTILITLSFIAFSCGQKKAGTTASFQTEIFCDHCNTCGSCKNRVETALLSISGIKHADMNVSKKNISVSFDASKITEKQIKTAISKTGFSAGDVPADPDAYDNLDDCCKRK